MPTLRTDGPPRPGFVGDESGAVAIVVALLLTVLLGFAAFGIDLGAMYRDKAQLQARSDLAALGAVLHVEDADAHARMILDRNRLGPENLQTMQFGRFRRDPSMAPGDRFLPLDPGSDGINAVAIDVAGSAPLHFSRLFLGGDSVPLAVASTATRTQGASFTLGSRLAALDGGVLNALLSEALGASVALTALDYTALAAADLTLLSFVDALALRGGLEAANYHDIATAALQLPTLLAALSDTQAGATAALLLSLADLAPPVSVPLDRVVGFPDPALGLTVSDFLGMTQVSALDLVMATADVVTAGRAVDLDLAVALPGLLALDTALLVQEREAQSGWVAVAEPRATLHTAQTRLKLDLDLAPTLLGGLGSGVTALALELPVYVELANATVELTDVNCRPTAPTDEVARFSTATLSTGASGGTRVAELFIGAFPAQDFNAAQPLGPASLGHADFLDLALVIALPLLPDIRIGLMTLQIRAHLPLGTTATESVGFTAAEVEAQDNVRSFGAAAPVSGAVAALLGPGNISVRVKPAHAGLVSGLVASLVNSVLSLLTDTLGGSLAGLVGGVLDQVLAALGLRLGEADLTLVGLNCEMVRLVR